MDFVNWTFFAISVTAGARANGSKSAISLQWSQLAQNFRICFAFHQPFFLSKNYAKNLDRSFPVLSQFTRLTYRQTDSGVTKGDVARVAMVSPYFFLRKKSDDLYSHRFWKWWHFSAVVSSPLSSFHVVCPVFVLNSATKN